MSAKKYNILLPAAVFILLMFSLIMSSCAKSGPGINTTGDEQIVRDLVTKYMEAVKSKDVGALITHSGLPVDDAMKQNIISGAKQFFENSVTIEVKDFLIKKVDIDGGIAFITVEETRKIAPKTGPTPPGLDTDFKTVQETFVLIRRDGKWKIDAMNTLHLANFNFKEADKAAITELNNMGVGRLFTLLIDPDVSCTIAAIGSMAVPGFQSARENGQLTSCKSNLKNIGTALEMYSTDNGGHYPESLDQLKGDYLKLIPTCPSAGKDTYSDSYKSSEDPDKYEVFCKGSNHSNQGVPADYPQYNSTEGLKVGPMPMN
ncbi:MAG: hypothetical protein LWY06_18200 [Firmicutes bacterium]|nr:hypothetical protein [Bacillota bacterium]